MTSEANVTTEEHDPQEHGPETVCYTGGPGEPYYLPTITCICGWYSGRCDDWAEAGEIFDDHLRETKT